MKKFITLLLCLTFAQFAFAQAGVGTTSPSTNSQLEVASESKGVLLPRLSAVQVAALTVTLTNAANVADSGMVIFNIPENCLQVWNGVEFNCLSIVTGGSLGNAGAVKVNITGASTAASTNDITHASAFVFTSNGGGGTYAQGVFAAVNVTASDLTLSASPTTNWPENEPTPTLTGGIYTDDRVFTSETNDAWRENDIPGQVHIWRVVVLGNPGSANGGQIEIRLRNPESGFVTGYVQQVPAQAGLYAQTYTLTTIADNASLPSSGGFGYVLELRSNSNAQIFWIESITRISIFNE